MHPIVAVTLEGLKVTELVVGSLAGIGVGVAAGVAPRLRPSLPIAAAAVGALLLVGFRVADGWVVAAIGLPALTTLVTRRRAASSRGTTAACATSAVLGAVLLMPAATSMVAVPRPVVIGAFAALAGLAALAADRRLSPTAVVAVAAWSAFGLFLCNPDTEGASLVGALLAAVATTATLVAVIQRRPHPDAFPERRSPPPTAGGAAVPIVLLLVWIGAFGASGREETIIGGYACLGVLLVLPVAVGLAWLVPDHDQRPTQLSGRLLTAVQAPLVVVCARVAGVRTTAERAILVSGACLALATAVLTLALGHRPRPERRPSTGPAPEPITDG